MKRYESNLLDFKARTLKNIIKVPQITQSECQTRIFGALGSILLDVGFPADATLSGTNISTIPLQKSLTSLATAGTGNFVQVKYNGRMVARSTSNTGKRLQLSTGDANTYIVAAKAASVSQTCALIGGTSVGGQVSPYLYQTSGSGNVWYGSAAVGGYNRCNGCPNANIYTTMEVYSRGAAWETATGFAVGGTSTTTADFIGDIGVIVRCSSVPTDDQYYEVARTIREYHGLPALVPFTYFGNSLGGGGWFENMILPSRAARKNNSIGAMGTLQIASELPDRLPGEDYNEQQLVSMIWEGTNSLGSGETAVTVLNATWSICDQMRARGYKVIVGNIMPRADTLWNSTKETERLAYNAGILNGWRSHADCFFDVTSDSRLSDPTNTTYFNADKLHLSATGYSVLGSIVQPQVISLLNSMGIV